MSSFTQFDSSGGCNNGVANNRFNVKYIYDDNREEEKRDGAAVHKKGA